MIKGSVYTDPTAKKELHKANIRIYNSELVKTIVDWSLADPSINGDTVHNDLLALESHDYETNDDGTYEIYVVPGKYDVLLDKAAFLDCVYILKKLEENDIVDLGLKPLLAGDVDKNGLISGYDVSTFKSLYKKYTTDPGVEPSYDLDEDTVIAGAEMSYVKTNYLKTREVINLEN